MEEKKDIIITCKGCGQEFLFTVSEQNFYDEKGFTYPKRCRECREARKKGVDNNAN